MQLPFILHNILHFITTFSTKHILDEIMAIIKKIKFLWTDGVFLCRGDAQIVWLVMDTRKGVCESKFKNCLCLVPFCVGQQINEISALDKSIMIM
jgi:hypothetical protein